MVVLGSLAVTVCLVCVCIRSSYEAAQEWALPVQFCHLHALPLSPAFPQDCARDGQWLNFLLFVQLHDYPLQQVCPSAFSLVIGQLYPLQQVCVSSAFSLVIGQLYPLQQVCLFCIQSCDWTVIPATAGVSLLHSVL